MSISKAPAAHRVGIRTREEPEMSIHEQANATTSQPETTKRRRAAWLRTRPGLAAAAAVAAFGLAALTAGAASAASLPNGPTIQLGQYPVPASAPQPQHVAGGGMLPSDDGSLGNAASIAVTGERSPDGPEVVTIPGGSSAWGTQLETDEPSTAPTLGPAQVWYFQRVGYVGVNTPATTAAGGTDMLAVPVYRIINYNPDGLYTCLEALGGQPAAGSIVDSNGCDVNGAPQTNQLWVVGSPGQTNDTINATTGAFDGNSGPQIYSSYLQGSSTAESGLSDSVIENVATLAADGWNTAQAPVLSADANSTGGASPLTLHAQSTLTSENSTWNIVAAPGSPE